MKKYRMLFAVLLVGMSGVAIAEAQVEAAKLRGSAAKKLTRGMVNVVTAPLEIAHDVSMHSQRGIQQGQYPVTAIPEGLVKGVFTGLVQTLRRLAAGTYDVVTFPFEVPANYESLVQPPTVFTSGYWSAPPKVRDVK